LSRLRAGCSFRTQPDTFSHPAVYLLPLSMQDFEHNLTPEDYAVCFKVRL
jgi:hypothetical protein